MTRSRQVPTHTHITRDIKPLGLCPSCDDCHERQGVTGDQVYDALHASMEDKRAQDTLRLMAVARRTHPELHAKYVQWLAEGFALAEAVDEAMATTAREVGLE